MTLKDIANEVGTTPATVSRVLNGYNKNFSVTEALRERILDVAKRSNYHPNPLYKGIRTTKGLPVSIVFPCADLMTTYTVSNTAVQTIAQDLHDHGRECLFSFSFNQDLGTYSAPHWRTSALVLPDVRTPAQLCELGAMKAPIVVVNGSGNGSCDVASCDTRQNMLTIFNMLRSFGHRRIFYATYGAYPVQHYSVDGRENAYCDCCRKFGLPILDGWDTRTEDESIHLDLAIAQKATAVICYNHGTATRMLHEAWLRGIKVPEDLSMICFNDDPLLPYTNPALTCLDPDGTTLGHAATKLLMKRLECGSELVPQSVETAGRLIERASIARPKHAS